MGEVIVGASQGVAKCRDIKRLATQSDRWSFATISELQGTPWEALPGRGDDAIAVRIRLSEEGETPMPVNLGEHREIKRRHAALSRMHGNQSQCVAAESHRGM